MKYSEMMFGQASHEIGCYNADTILIRGFNGIINNRMICLKALGHRYHEYGIADYSILLCSSDIEPKHGDLVVSFDGLQPVIYVFRPDATEDYDGEKRVLRDPAKIDAVIVSSFNYYR